MTMLAAAALALAAPVFVWAQDETAAVGAGKVLDIVPKVLDIVGVSAGIEGTLADLGAKVTEKEIKIAAKRNVFRGNSRYRQACTSCDWDVSHISRRAFLARCFNSDHSRAGLTFPAIALSPASLAQLLRLW
jgi:hypothetical protein